MSCASVLAVLYFLLVAPPSPQPLIFFFFRSRSISWALGRPGGEPDPQLLHDLAPLPALILPRAPAASSRC